MRPAARGAAATIATATALLLTGGAPPTANATAEGSRARESLIPAGTEFDVRLERALGTRTHAPDDRWSATLAAPITHQDRVLVTDGTVTGVVSEAGPIEVRGDTSQVTRQVLEVLAVEPRDLRVNGRRFPIRAEVIAADLREGDGRLTGEDVAVVGDGARPDSLPAADGAAPDSLPAAVPGDEDEVLALLGAARGGGPATVIAVAPEGTEIELQEGTAFRLRLLEDVRVRP